MKRCESAKQRGRRLRLFALKPSQNKGANFKCLRLALKLLQRWPQLWPNARSKSLQPSAPRRPLRASQAEQLRARRPLAKPKRARPPQSSAAKLRPVQPQLSRGKRFCDSTAAALDQRWRLNRCSLHLNYPPPLARGEVVAASRRLLAGLRKPQAAALQAPASPYEAVRIGQATWPALRLFALKPSQNKDANFERLHCGLVVYARSSASLITRPAGVQIKTLNPKRFVSGWYWGGLKQPPRRAAPRPSGSRRAASEGKP